MSSAEREADRFGTDPNGPTDDNSNEPEAFVEIEEATGHIGSDDEAENDVENDGDDQWSAQVGVLDEAAYPLLRRYFPSKVGGKPAWLNPRDLPAAAKLRCGACDYPLRFLLQVYAPLEGNRPDAFHRSVLLFVCGRGGCVARSAPGSLVALRCQMPRANPFYPSEPVDPPEERMSEAELASAEAAEAFPGSPLCDACGARGPKACGKCRSVHYCGREHQVEAWKAGHSAECRLLSEGGQRRGRAPVLPSVLFPSHELLIDEEPAVDRDAKDADDRRIEDSVRTGAGFKDELEPGEEEMWAAAEPKRKNDPVFEAFRRRTARMPSQVLRYAVEGSEPLWVDSKNQPDQGTVPPCGACGGPRRFEFQVLPQLLYYLKVDADSALAADPAGSQSLDWGTLAVYTCAANCGDQMSYLDEWVWRQPPTD